MPSALALMWVPLHLFLAGYYLAFHFRDHAEDHLFFAGIWLLAALYSVGCAGLYAASGPTEGVRWQQIQFLAAGFFFPLVALFMWRFAVARPTRIMVGVLFGISWLFALGNLLTPWFWSTTPSVKAFQLGALAVSYQEMAPAWMGLLCFVWGMSLLLFSVGLGVRAWRQGKPGSVPLLVGLVAVFGCGLSDVLVSSGALRFIYVVEHGFPVFAFAAAYFMQARVFTTHSDLETRTAELEQANAELARVNRELSTLDRMKEDLLANISHELRTPLVSIRGYAEVMLAGRLGPLSAEQEQGLRIALRNTNRLLALIGNLLGYAKLQDGRLQLRRRPVKLANVVRDAVDTALPLVTEHGLTLTTTLPQGRSLSLVGDAAKLQQVLDNLLHNAVKHTDPGGTIRVTAQQDPTGEIQLRVEDSGVGIPAEDRERIFDRFYRSATSEARGASGTGIGLSIARSLVRLHGGELRALPREGGGTVFEITLPGLPPQAEEAEADPAEPPLRATAQVPTILLVDDDLDVVEFLTMAMEQEGYAVQVAHDGERGLALAQSQPFDLMLLDLTMRGMGGVEVLKALRADQQTADLPVVVVTALGGDDVRSRCLSVGADDFLVKPVAFEELQRVVRRVLADR